MGIEGNILKKEAISNLIIELFDKHIGDLSKNVNIDDAGWIGRTHYDDIIIKEIDGLIKINILETNGNNIRLVITNNNPLRKNTNYKLKFNQIDYFIASKNEIINENNKIRKGKEAIIKYNELYNKNPRLLPFFTFIGIHNMLRASSMPANIDDVLKEGFSPQEWIAIAIKYVPLLSLDLIQNTFGIEVTQQSFNQANKLKLFSSPMATPLKIEKDHYVSGIMNVLKWSEIKSVLTKENIIFMGLSWFIIDVLDENCAIPNYPDYSLYILDPMKEFIENITQQNWLSLNSNLNTATEKLELNNINWASDIFFIPEVV